MLYRDDGRAGRKLSALGFGCMRFPKKGNGFDLDKADELLRAAIDGGVNYLDTAYIYGNSEAVMGRILSRDGLRDKVYIATKMPLFMVRSAADFDKYFNRQLERLQTGRIDYYLLHMLGDTRLWNRLKQMGVEEWLAKRVEEGKIGKAGFSYHGGREQFQLLLDEYDWDFVQIQYNYMDEYNQAGRDGLELAAARGLPVIVMEPLRGGMLAGGLPKAAKDVFKSADPDMSPAEWGLRWVWNHPGVTVLLSGMSDMAQLEENLRVAGDAAPGLLDAKQLEVFEEVKRTLNTVVKVGCTACGYCMPCPAGVDIPTCFSSYNMIFAYGAGTAMRRHMQNINALGANPRFARKCNGCGKCEKRCPQGIKIREGLKAASKKLEPWWFRAASGAYRRIVKRT